MPSRLARERRIPAAADAATCTRATIQTVTPDPARGLNLAQDWGVIVSDLVPGGPAEFAGLRPRTSFSASTAADGQPPLLAFSLYARNAGETIELAVLRGKDQFVVNVPASTAARCRSPADRPTRAERGYQLASWLAIDDRLDRCFSLRVLRRHQPPGPTIRTRRTSCSRATSSIPQRADDSTLSV